MLLPKISSGTTKKQLGRISEAEIKELFDQLPRYITNNCRFIGFAPPNKGITVEWRPKDSALLISPTESTDEQIVLVGRVLGLIVLQTKGFGDTEEWKAYAKAHKYNGKEPFDKDLDVREDFARCFALYLTHPDQLKTKNLRKFKAIDSVNDLIWKNQ